MVDSWNWLLEVLVPPLVNSAIESEKRRQNASKRNDRNKVTINGPDAVDHRNAFASCSHIAELKSLLPASCGYYINEDSAKLTSFINHPKPKSKKIAHIDIRPNVTIKRITVNENTSVEYPVEIETVPTHLLFTDEENYIENSSE